MSNLRLRWRGRRYLLAQGERGGIMIRMSLDMRRIMMCVALRLYLQASIVYLSMLSETADCFGLSLVKNNDLLY